MHHNKFKTNKKISNPLFMLNKICFWRKGWGVILLRNFLGVGGRSSNDTACYPRVKGVEIWLFLRYVVDGRLSVYPPELAYCKSMRNRPCACLYRNLYHGISLHSSVSMLLSMFTFDPGLVMSCTS